MADCCTTPAVFALRLLVDDLLIYIPASDLEIAFESDIIFTLYFADSLRRNDRDVSPDTIICHEVLQFLVYIDQPNSRTKLFQSI